VGIPPYYPLFYPETPDNPVYMPKKFLGKIKLGFPKLDSCFEMGVKIKKRIFGKILENWVLCLLFYLWKILEMKSG